VVVVVFGVWGGGWPLWGVGWRLESLEVEEGYSIENIIIVEGILG
jgi:hypothetical protein